MEPAEVPSPCTGVCRLDERDICIGCGRTMAEIAAWPDANGERKLEIRQQAAERLAHAVRRSTKS